jgi:hypothetical protein
MGLAVSDALRLMIGRIAADTALPFEPLTPNAETITAMRAGAKSSRRVAPLPVDAPPPLATHPGSTGALLERAAMTPESVISCSRYAPLR